MYAITVYCQTAIKNFELNWNEMEVKRYNTLNLNELSCIIYVYNMNKTRLGFSSYTILYIDKEKTTT